MVINYWYISDCHFNHKNIIKYSKRLQFCNNEERDIILNGTPSEQKSLVISDNSIQLMNETLISNWNERVKSNDIVYNLGDFVFGNNTFDSIFSRLNGKMVFIEGNHDRESIKNKHRFHEYHKFLEVKINGQDMTLCHYALRTWNGMHHKAWNLFGHSHHSLPEEKNSLSVDVGVDGKDYNYSPINFDQLSQIMNKKLFKLNEI